ncbi:hypothetical protein HHI36_007298 [Cryptolaemus montrouzieri]|uniref:Uncharacterized protein n=1 Tax=Cryptolaemus montrouzieri TaxID=559131 RepID=A0ABD2MP44_9CUCU
METCEGPCGELHDTTKAKITSTEVENNTGSITINNPLIAAVPGKVYDTTKTFVPTTTSGESDDITIVSTSKSTYEAHDITNHISTTTESCKDPCDNTNGINLTSVNSQSSIEVNDNSGILVNVNEVIQKIIAKITGILLALPSKILQIVSAILPVVVRIIEVFSGFDLPYN